MRVLLVSARGADRGFGGAERYVDLLRDGLAARGHAITVLAAYPPRDDASPARATRRRTDPLVDPVRRVRDRVDGFVAGVPGDLDAALDGVDLVHTHNLPGIGTGVWELARRRGIPVVHTLHDYGLLCARSSLRRRDGMPCPPRPAVCELRRRRLTRWAGGVAVVIAVSEHVRRRHAGVFSPITAWQVVPPPRLPGPAVPGPPPPALRRLGYIGALTPEKGVDALVACAPALARRGVSISLAGAGRLAGRIRAASVHDAGHLRGESLRRFLADHDAGIVCSTWEEPAVTFAAREWLAARRPVIASRAGALAQLAAEPGVIGYDGTSLGLLAAVEEARSPATWRRLTAELSDVGAETAGDAGRRAAAGDAGDGDAHELDRWVDAHLDAYARALAARAPR